MWRDEKTEYLRRNRDYTRLLDDGDTDAQPPRAYNGERSNDRQLVTDEDDGLPERQEYLNRRQRLKELERRKLTKGKNGLHVSGARNEVPKAGEQSKNDGVSSHGRNSFLSKGKKKLPYDRSFGSFFGPSQPVVAKRIIEEARAREEAEVVAARNATARLEAERNKSVASLSAQKFSLVRKPPRPKPVNKTTEKAQKLKEARDYSFLFDDSPLPGPKEAAREGPAPLKPGMEKHGSAFVQANKQPPRSISSEQLKRTVGSRGSDGSTKSSIPLQNQFKSPSRLLPRQGPHDRYPSDKFAVQSSSAKQPTSTVFSFSPGAPDPRKGADVRKEAMPRELVCASTGKKSSPQIVDRNPTYITDRHHPQRSARPPPRHADRPSSRATSAQAADRLPSRASSSQAADRLPSRATSAQAADRLPSRASSFQAPDRLPSRSTSAQAADRRPIQPAGRLSIQVKDTGMVKGSERGLVTSQVLKKGGPKGSSYRAGAAREEPRRQVSASRVLPPSKASSRPGLCEYTRGTRYSDSWRGEPRPHKRARSTSEESDERCRRDKLPTIGVNTVRCVRRGAQIPSEEDDDSFIDDDDDPGNVSSMIHSIMGYNPNKYRGNDDIDDRTMEVGFRTIQAEERRSAREARLEDERELALIEAEEREERLRKAKRKRNQIDR